MCLVSKCRRHAAIESLFSAILFACAEDLSSSLVPPRTGIGVRAARDFGRDPGDRFTRLSDALPVAQMPKFSAAHSIEWCSFKEQELELICAYAGLFPSIRELRLSHLEIRGPTATRVLSTGVSAYPPLRALVFNRVLVGEPSSDSDSDLDSASDSAGDASEEIAAVEDLNLSQLEELVIIGGTAEGSEFLTDFSASCPPIYLKSVSFHRDADYSEETEYLPAMHALLLVCASRLQTLRLDPSFDDDEDTRNFNEMLLTLAPFPALKTLSLELRDNRQAHFVLSNLNATNLTTIALQIALENVDAADGEENLEEILAAVLPWDKSQRTSMKTLLQTRYPMLRVVVQFYAERRSPAHFDRCLRKRMEHNPRRALRKTKEDVETILDIEWSDDNFQPAIFDAESGKPVNLAWNKDCGLAEPDTDDESGHEPSLSEY
ncbi:hypothetical protein MKEN_00373000 [Mycena kentingensis (nom. inval.)]|nr:hypothetical protein MKEN_00373000 [Mycena kentingensis (nom. inval.)]